MAVIKLIKACRLSAVTSEVSQFTRPIAVSFLKAKTFQPSSIFQGKIEEALASESVGLFSG